MKNKEFLLRNTKFETKIIIPYKSELTCPADSIDATIVTLSL